VATLAIPGAVIDAWTWPHLRAGSFVVVPHPPHFP